MTSLPAMRILPFKVSLSSQYDCGLTDDEAARSIFLVTLLANKTPFVARSSERTISLLWNLSHHFLLEAQDLEEVKHHARYLQTISTDLTTWDQSPLSDIVKFSSEKTLQRVRTFWESYAAPSQLDDETKFLQSIKQSHAALKDTPGTFEGSRGTGIHCLMAETAVAQCKLHLWQHGVAVGGTINTNTDKEGFANPLFMYSSNDSKTSHGPSLSPTTDYLSAFHTPHAVDDAHTVRQQMQSLTACAKAEFAAWITSFAGRLQPAKVHILFHTGDPILLAYDIQACIPSTTSLYKVSHNCFRQQFGDISIVDTHHYKGMTHFDVISAGFLADKFGILSVLPATVPLLCSSALSVLYTESGLFDSTNFTDFLDVVLRADLPTVAVLTGVCPASVLSGVTTEFSVWDASVRDDSKTTSRVRIAWRLLKEHMATAASMKTQAFKFDHKELALFFADWFHAIFFFDEAEKMSARKKYTKPYTRATLRSKRVAHSTVHYTSGVIVALLGLARLAVNTDWSACIEAFQNLLISDKRFSELRPRIQETSTLLRLAGLTTMTEFHKLMPMAVTTPQDSMSPITCLVVTIPRHDYIKASKSSSGNTSGSSISMRLKTLDGLNHEFTAVQVIDGRLYRDGDGSEGCKVVKDDTHLIVTANVPAWLLGGGCNSHCVELAIVLHSRTFQDLSSNNPSGARVLFKYAADDQCISLLPVNRVTATDHSEFDFDLKLTDQGDHGLPGMAAHAKLNEECKVQMFLFTAHLQNTIASNTKTKDVTARFERISPYLLQIRWKGSVHTVFFPFPMGKLTCSQKPEGQDLVVVIQSSPVLVYDSTSYARSAFPVVRTGSQVMALSVGYLNPSQQPAINFHSARTAALLWLMNIASITGSAVERSPVQMPEFMPTGGLLLEHLCCRLGFPNFRLGQSNWACYQLVHVDRQDPNCRTASLSRGYEAVRARVDSLLVVNAVKHDLHGGVLFLDGYYITIEPTEKATSSMQSFQNRFPGAMDQRLLSDIDLLYFKNLIPTAVERCRTTWKHRSKCEYGQPGASIPLSTKTGEPPMCSCGMGKDIDDLPTAFVAPLGKVATRVAIPLLFQPPYKSGQAKGVMHTCLTDHGKKIYDEFAEDPKETSEGAERKCYYCGTPKKTLKTCGDCNKTEYCNAKCQAADLRRHRKLQCRKGEEWKEFLPKGEKEELVSGSEGFEQILPVRRYGWI